MSVLQVDFGLRCSWVMNAAFRLVTFANTTKPKVLTRPRLLAGVTLALKSLKRALLGSALSVLTRINAVCDRPLLAY
jgi:hypothetical protein